jgi:hypothetical protein
MEAFTATDISPYAPHAGRLEILLVLQTFGDSGYTNGMFRHSFLVAWGVSPLDQGYGQKVGLFVNEGGKPTETQVLQRHLYSVNNLMMPNQCAFPSSRESFPKFQALARITTLSPTIPVGIRCLSSKQNQR